MLFLGELAALVVNDFLFDEEVNAHA